MKNIRNNYKYLSYKYYNLKKNYLTNMEFFFCQLTNKFFFKKKFIWKKYLLSSKLFWYFKFLKNNLTIKKIYNNNTINFKIKFDYYYNSYKFLDLYNFITLTNIWLKRGFSCELKLFGLGYRINQISSCLFRFFLGFSTFIYLFIYDEYALVFSKILDRKLLIFSFDPRKLNSIVSSLMLLKRLSVYRLAGIVKPNKYIRIKTGKLR